MTGSSYIPIVVPIVAFAAMAFWLGLVYYADAHPGYRRRPQRESGGTATASETARVAPGPRHDAQPGASVPAGPREHERIDEHASATVSR